MNVMSLTLFLNIHTLVDEWYTAIILYIKIIALILKIYVYPYTRLVAGYAIQDLSSWDLKSGCQQIISSTTWTIPVMKF